MGGWFLDIFIEYPYRVLVGRLKTRGCNAWLITKATVTSSGCPTALCGRPVAEIYYKYLVNGETYTGIHQKGFIFYNSGENYARLLAPGRELAVRVRPTDPSVSIVRDEDQIPSTAVGNTSQLD